ncbi:MAG TPA: VPLPA-CTERM sorting domain-containing protein [Steroidobacteraceae bacterium]|jgi:hypothetical protein
MHISLKAAVAAALAVGAALAGTAAQAANTITNVPTTPGGSDLVLFVADATTGQFFAQDLGVSLNQTVTAAKVAADGIFTTAGSFTTPTSFAGTDALLATFLGGIAASEFTAGDVSYSIMAADDTSTILNPGSERALITSVNDYSVVSPTTTFTNNNVKSYVAGAKTFFNDVNNNYAGGNTSASYGWGTGTGATLAPNSFISASLSNGGAIGTAQTMYLFGVNSTTTAAPSNPYVGATINVSQQGVITVTNNSSAVPLPAAVWLLGSGLLGLVGVGRRRAITPA